MCINPCSHSMLRPISRDRQSIIIFLICQATFRFFHATNLRAPMVHCARIAQRLAPTSPNTICMASHAPRLLSMPRASTSVNHEAHTPSRRGSVSERVTDLLIKRMINCLDCGFCMVECFPCKRFDRQTKTLAVESSIQCGKCLQLKFCMGWRHRFWRRIIVEG